MKISQVHAIPLSVPVDVEIVGLRRSTNLSCVVVRIDTDDGRTGCGFTAITEEEIVASAIDEVAAHALVGQDSMRTEQLWNKLYWLLTPRGQSGYGSHAIAAHDVAPGAARRQAFALKSLRTARAAFTRGRDARRTVRGSRARSAARSPRASASGSA